MINQAIEDVKLNGMRQILNYCKENDHPVEAEAMKKKIQEKKGQQI